MALEQRRGNTVIVCDRAVGRVLLGYFLGTQPDQLPFLEVFPGVVELRRRMIKSALARLARLARGRNPHGHPPPQTPITACSGRSSVPMRRAGCRRQSEPRSGACPEVQGGQCLLLLTPCLLTPRHVRRRTHSGFVATNLEVAAGSATTAAGPGTMGTSQQFNNASVA